MKLFEYDYRDTPPAYGAIDIQELMKIHERRIQFDTSAGTMILKFLPWRDYVATTRKLEENPEYIKLREEGVLLNHVDESNKELYTRKIDVGRQIAKYVDEYALGCFQDPVISSLDELDAIYRALDKAERLVLEQLILTLTQDIPLEEVDFTLYDVAKNYGVNILNESMFENPAKVQVTTLINNLHREKEEIENELSG